MLRVILSLFVIIVSSNSYAEDTLPPHKPGEVIVKYKSDITSRISTLKIANSVMSKVEMSGYKIEGYQQHLNIGLFKIPKYKTVEIAVKELNEMDGVEYAEPNYKVYFSERAPLGFESLDRDL